MKSRPEPSCRVSVNTPETAVPRPSVQRPPAPRASSSAENVTAESLIDVQNVADGIAAEDDPNRCGRTDPVNPGFVAQIRRAHGRRRPVGEHDLAPVHPATTCPALIRSSVAAGISFVSSSGSSVVKVWAMKSRSEQSR